ncbi:hypothetical protein [Silvimonas iriomotensis]|nr:hypothetical protein [Silvimonas iriomotensis]
MTDHVDQVNTANAGVLHAVVCAKWRDGAAVYGRVSPGRIDTARYKLV